MDKNTIIGLVVIFLLLIGFSYFTRPSQEEIQQTQQTQLRQDSIAQVMARAAEEQKRNMQLSQDTMAATAQDSVFMRDTMPERLITLENNKIKVQISTRGGRIVFVELKEYRTHDSLPLILWRDSKTEFGLNFYAGNKQVNTVEEMFFCSTPDAVLNADSKEQELSLKLFSADNKYLEYFYRLAPDSYMVDFSIRTQGMNDVIASNSSFLTLHWGIDMPQLEKSKDFENRYTGVYYKFYEDNVENMSLTSAKEEESLTTKVQWIAFKQQFFSSILIFQHPVSDVLLRSETSTAPEYLKDVYTEIPLPYSGKTDEQYDMQFFFGPNSYPILKEYGNDLKLTELIDMGWKWISWFNKYFVIPIFNFLENNTTLNYGIIILLLTLIIKIILFPLTYKSYMSQARMRVLKPQVDELSKKYPADKAMEKQQAVMKLYKQAGVNPMGGCLPMLLQMPILIALFYFFPGAIELRQQSFLWANDLASYDSIATLPFTIPFYGNHVSLFCLLMTATNIIYMVMNNKNQPQNDQMKGMQTMMYIMPIMFLFIFNSYSSGLSYYYFIATLITILQTWIIRKFVDDQKLLHQIEVAKSKPTKKTGFQRRLEDMQKIQAQKLKEQQKRKK